MALTPIKVLLFLAGGTAAAGATAYVAGVFEPYLNRPAATAARLPAEQKVAALSPSEQPVENPKAATPEATDQPAAKAQVPPKVEVPSFDIVRVQSDGSIVIAGHAASNAKVEAVIGSRVIGSAVAGPEGDFAVAVEERLKPGDYQIVLRSSAPDKVVATSRETAVVSIPEKSDGQVLALVEEPGKPSELITVPEPGQPKAGAPSIPSPSAQSEKPAGEPSSGNGAAAENKQATEGPAPPDNQQTAAAIDAPKPAPEQPADGPRLAVEAVEIEGRRIFVAGSADPGRLVRAYANEILLGQTETSEAGRFLVETERDLPVGDYIIRVDALAPNGEKVLARVAVPFEREAGENIAAVAPPATSSETPRPGASATGKADRPAAAASAEPSQTPATGATAASQPATGAAPASEAKVETPATAEKPADTGTAGAGQPGSAQPTPPEPGVAAAPVETVAPKLQNVDNSVIIRRGDTLWRISKRVYGRGVRYSTIYLANQEQIRDPNMIWPGQVFNVPQKTDEGEKADMTRLGAQAVPPPVQQ